MGSWWKSNCNRTSKVIINHEDDYTSYVRTVSYGRVFYARIYGPSADRENEVSNIFIISLGSKRWRLKQTFEFSGPYNRVRPAKLTNHSARTN